MYSEKLFIIIWFVSIIIHTVLLISSWDMFPTKLNYTELASSKDERLMAGGKRAVLFVINGLNATLFYNGLKTMDHSYIRNIIIDQGNWGLSWSTGTKSEDYITSLLSGSKNDDLIWFNSTYNWPDDITNYLKKTYYFGPPIGKHFINNEKWEIYKYSEGWDRYTRLYADVTMDTWTTEQVTYVLNNHTNKTDKLLYIIGYESLNIINKYEGKHSENIVKAFDRIMANIEFLVNKFNNIFDDNGTLFILTSNYKTNKLEYKKESSRETIVPILVWGTQIVSRWSKLKETYWSVNVKDHKIKNQIDIAALLACILGIPTPANSIGHLPINYLKNNASFIARCTLSNIKQLKTLFLYEYNKINNYRTLLKMSQIFAPIDLKSINKLYKRFTENVDKDKHNTVINEGETLLEHLIDGIIYYRNYYSFVTKLLIGISYFGWLIYLCTNLFIGDKIESVTAENSGNHVITINNNLSQEETTAVNNDREEDNGSTITKVVGEQEINTIEGNKNWKRYFIPTSIYRFLFNLIFTLILLVMVVLSTLASWPIKIITYLILLFIIWWSVIKCFRNCLICKKILLFNRNDPLTNFKFTVYLLLFFLQCCLFMNKILLTVLLFLIMFSVPFVDFEKVKTCYIGDWILSSLMLIFSLGSSSKQNTTVPFIIMQTVFFIVFSLITSIYFGIKFTDYPLLIFALVGITSATVLNCLLDEEKILNKTIFLMFLLLFYTFIILIGSDTLLIRLIQSGICLSIPYVITAKGFETIIYLSIIIHLITWITVETYKKLNDDEEIIELTNELDMKSRNISYKNTVKWNDARRAFITTIYIIVTYIALGNQKNIIEVFNGINLELNFYTWIQLIVYLIKLQTITTTCIMVYIIVSKLSNTNIVFELLSIITLLALMGFILLIIAIIMNAFSTDETSVADYIFSQILILTILLAYPLASSLVSPSLLTLQHVYSPPQQISAIINN